MRVRGLMLDLDGTLYFGGRAVDGAREAVARLKAAGLVLRYVTNTTRKPRRAVAEGMRNLGFDVEDAEILTPAGAAANLIGTGSCLALVDESLLEDLRAVTRTDDGPDYVLVGDLGEGFTYTRLDQAFRCLVGGAELLALQKNRYWRTGAGLSLDAGPFVAALEYASGKRATILGKPTAEFFQGALEEMGLAAEEVAMVGDDPESDVAGAKRAGLKGVQVRTGKWSMGNEAREADLVLDSLRLARVANAMGGRAMKIHDVAVSTQERYQLVSITEEVSNAVREAGVEEGLCVISSTHTTAAVTVNEDYDRDVPGDLAAACRAFLGTLDVRFEHMEGNSDSHFLTSLFGQSQTLLVRDGRPDLGRWQGVFLAEFDGPRQRTVRVAVM